METAVVVWLGVACTFVLAALAWVMSGFEPALGVSGVTDEAEAKGLHLLLENLTSGQRRQFEKFGYFDVVGSATGKRYRIHYGTSRNVVDLTEADVIGAGRCFAPRGELARGDCMLAQKIALENFEEEPLRIARHF